MTFADKGRGYTNCLKIADIIRPNGYPHTVYNGNNETNEYGLTDVVAIIGGTEARQIRHSRLWRIVYLK